MYKIEFMERDAPSDEDVATIVGQRMTAHLEAQLRGRDKLKAERMERFIPLAQELAQSEEGRTLLAMLLDDVYHEAVHKRTISETLPPAEKPRKLETRRRQKIKMWAVNNCPL
jgi:ATP-dependent RNA helicase DeaD